MNASCDVLIIGGGLIGLAIALELRLQGASVTVLSRNFKQAASHAAAGMLAPQAEALPLGSLWDLSIRSRDLYPTWTERLTEITGQPTGYWPCGILAPVYADLPAPPEPHASSQPTAQWLTASVVQQKYPGLSAEVIGGWWFPQDAQVDNRALTHCLWAAAQQSGVRIQEGVAVTAIQNQGSSVIGVDTAAGTWQASHYVLAAGAWSGDLLPIPTYPRKGQMFSLQIPLQNSHLLPLQTVLFGQEIYIVPRQNGQLVIGATSEDVGFTPSNTPVGVQQLLANAIRLFPSLQDFPITELWWGYRPTTPDESPLLGESPYGNLTLATGHHRNGILLAPITASLVANWVLRGDADPLLAAFHYSRLADSKTV
ncbi:FAD-dependent oxidoreductase [Neosynechococcus sphagnicola sy1]|uniref:glycine oxidase n=1 Tax=Neosynechococcus sphagnicola sy1 TaxID=1497020 RepID=A0A098TNT3_9CYAN|nr:glycine oxidase ThiO [Neosynechococcus sphagnicola]KGF73527.1 FAD-dependent oxidoreductase [Neosynechococcus sphagnicola sy1]